jgi:uncharacterized membrane protein YbhN (UPF0104 family)
MVLAPLSAHLLCALLLVADLVGRAFRIQWYLDGLGRRIRFRQAFQLNAWGDAAAGLTPMRFGGEMAKLAGLLRAGVPPQTGVVALGLEAAVTYPLVALFGGWLAWLFAPAWWQHARPAVDRAIEAGWPWVIVVGAVTLLGGVATWYWRRRVHRLPRDTSESPRPMGARLTWPIIAGAALSLFNVVARTLMLPLLALTLPEHPPFGVMAFGSFVLLYSQLFLPTPAGAGAVDLGFLSGMAGDLGASNTTLLVAWRFYTVGAGALLGLGLAAHHFGVRPAVQAISRLVRRPAP